jgi:hypothetical protein
MGRNETLSSLLARVRQRSSPITWILSSLPLLQKSVKSVTEELHKISRKGVDFALFNIPRIS